MDEKQKKTALLMGVVAFQFASNEDEAGIYLQGFAAAAAAFADKDELLAAMEKLDGVEAAEALAKLLATFRTSKRSTESRLVDQPQVLRAMRVAIIGQAEKIAREIA